MKVMVEVTNLETGFSRRMTREDFYKMFGKAQAREIIAGYLPHVDARVIDVEDGEAETEQGGRA